MTGPDAFANGALVGFFIGAVFGASALIVALQGRRARLKGRYPTVTTTSGYTTGMHVIDGEPREVGRLTYLDLGSKSVTVRLYDQDTDHDPGDAA